MHRGGSVADRPEISIYIVGKKTHDAYGSPMTFTKKKSIYIVGVESHYVYGVLGDVYGSSNAFYERGESIYIMVAM